MATRASRQGGGEVTALIEYLQSGLVWGTLLFIAGAVLVLDDHGEVPRTPLLGRWVTKARRRTEVGTPAPA
jgi:hypothetical protein